MFFGYQWYIRVFDEYLRLISSSFKPYSIKKALGCHSKVTVDSAMDNKVLMVNTHPYDQMIRFSTSYNCTPTRQNPIIWFKK